MGWIRWLGAGVLLVLVSMLLPFVAAGAVTPAAAVADIFVTEPYGQTETVQVEIPVTLSVPAPGPVTIDWRTVAGTAGSSDFTANSGRLTLAAGSSGGGVLVAIRADRTAEQAEAFTVELTAATGATLADATGTVTIRDGVRNGGVSVGDVSVLEPDAGTAQFAVPLTIAIVPTKAVNVTWELRSATGTVGSDIQAASGTTTIPKGALTAVVRVAVLGDTTVEPDETVEFVVTAVKNAALADGLGVIGLRNGDLAAPPTPTPTPAPTPTPTPTPTPVPSPTPTPVPGFTWLPPDGAVPSQGTVLYVESSVGDWVGQGQTYLYTLANSEIGVSTSGSRIDLSIDGEEYWDASLAEPAGPTVVTGLWSNLPGYTGGNPPALRFFGEGRSCISGSVNRFAVDEVTYEGGSLRSLTARFEQRCDATAPPMLGYLRFDVTDPTTPPPPGDPADFAWTPPAGVVPTSGNYLYYESRPGDYIGQGQTRLFTAFDTTFTVTDTSGHVRARSVQGSFDHWWDLDVSGPDAQDQLVRGLYADVQRYPFHNPVEGGLDFSGDGRGCNELDATFAVDEVSYDAEGLLSVTVRFEQRCGGSSTAPLFGAFRWSRNAGGPIFTSPPG